MSTNETTGTTMTKREMLDLLDAYEAVPDGATLPTRGPWTVLEALVERGVQGIGAMDEYGVGGESESDTIDEIRDQVERLDD